MSQATAVKPLKSALLSVYHKDGLEPLARQLHALGVTLYSTGGTQQFLEQLGLPVVPAEQLTGYPSIFGGRVKTLHPGIMGGILYRRDVQQDLDEATQYQIAPIDLVVVDLYPFEATVASSNDEAEIIEKIDIGGISLIRAAAKNHQDVVIISHRGQYELLGQWLAAGGTTLAQRRQLAAEAFATSSHYDTAIFNYFNQQEGLPLFRASAPQTRTLRYGENPHQRGWFHGPLQDMLEQLHGKELSYNNLVDVDAAVGLISAFDGADVPVFAIIKHTNACGMAQGESLAQAYERALAADPVSAFGGVLVCNKPLDVATAELLNALFFEVLIAPGYEPAALTILQSKKNRVLLQAKHFRQASRQYRTLLNGVLEMDADLHTDSATDLKPVTNVVPTAAQVEDLLFASHICKYTKSNTIVLVKDGQLLASGMGQTSRVDALRQAIEKAARFGFSLTGAVMASDAFFPFPDCVQIADEAGIVAVIQPGGSIKDQDSTDYCNAHGMAMVHTGVRHFRH